MQQLQDLHYPIHPIHPDHALRIFGSEAMQARTCTNREPFERIGKRHERRTANKTHGMEGVTT